MLGGMVAPWSCNTCSSSHTCQHYMTHMHLSQVGGWVLFATMDLLRSIKANTVDEHPLFVFDVEPQMPLYFYEELGYGSSNR